MFCVLWQYVAVDKTGQYVAVSGKRGVAHCNVSTKKWKLFGNESQVSSFPEY